MRNQLVVRCRNPALRSATPMDQLIGHWMEGLDRYVSRRAPPTHRTRILMSSLVRNSRTVVYVPIGWTSYCAARYGAFCGSELLPGKWSFNAVDYVFQASANNGLAGIMTYKFLGSSAKDCHLRGR